MRRLSWITALASLLTAGIFVVVLRFESCSTNGAIHQASNPDDTKQHPVPADEPVPNVSLPLRSSVSITPGEDVLTPPASNETTITVGTTQPSPQQDPRTDASSESSTADNEPKRLPDSWTNSLGMEFVSVTDTAVLFSVCDTRVQDYQAFVAETHRSWRKRNFLQGPTHPAVNVSWYDTKDFCIWLTEREHQSGQLGPGARYRLPTELEWSIAACGGPSSSESSFPWGEQWPPVWGAGNYHQRLHVDSYPKTSPVGSFSKNRSGLFDMGGNVWQWCEHYPSNSRPDRPMRGGSWDDFHPKVLSCSMTTYSVPYTLAEQVGFRIVLVLDSP